MDCQKIYKNISVRHTLCFMMFLGIFMAFLLRVNLSVAIVVMVKSPSINNSLQVLKNTTDVLFRNNKNSMVNESIVTHFNSSEETMIDDGLGEFEWNEMTQGLILGAFFWGYLVSQVPGGRIAELYGPRRVFGLSILANSVLCLILPMFTRMHWVLLLVIRALQGLTQGSLFPCLSATVAIWCPPSERDRFISFVVQGATLGAVISLPGCGLIGSQLGWDAIFYASGCVSLVWCFFWFIIVEDSPQKHTRISKRELLYIVKNVPDRPKQSPPVPWLQALTSFQFLVGCIAAIGNDFGFHTLLTYAPKFMKSALGFDLQQNTMLSSLPFLAQYVFAFCYAAFAGWLLARGVRIVVIRKLSVFCSHLLPACGLVILSFSTHNIVLCVTALTFSVAFIGAFTCGFFQNPLDIAPNFTGSLTGVMNMLGSTTGVIAALIAGFALQSYGIIDGWRVVFLVAAVMYSVSALPYLVFATCKIQSWNQVVTEPKKLQDIETTLIQTY